ncbi:DUF2213 domain-containing protein [Cupriavidus pauculus]|uniref:DUF2213 domain-containing protein n=1 Tax=Cupriavidus pauculus TaxID=82633 RepID=UPI001C9355A2|nr:DUF2213 domain-containing protein [Cupriavidus pauculus]MBY4733978.1 DUF2213 domain-containing protein [Cupriavidus pauculus]
MRFYTIQKLGPKRSLTPEGFLLCEEVPVARTGEMLYAPGEVPVEPGPDGLIRISRTPEEVFRDATMASCMGKDVTLHHPDDFVQPTNYASLTRGVMLNPRRGDGIADDLLVADLLIKHPDAIKAVQEEHIEEVSLGYEADYEQVAPGRGVQRNIVVNHVALEERGRCGPRCAIGDKESEDMKTTDSKPKGKRTWLDRVRTAFKAQDAEALEEALEESNTTDVEEDDPDDGKGGKTGDATSVLLKTILKRMEAQDAAIAALGKRRANDSEKEKTDDEDDDEDPTKKKTGDDGDLTQAETAPTLNQSEVDLYTGDSAASIPARAEILAPGIKLPTFDAATSTKDRATALCKCQRKALDTAYGTDAGKAAISPFLGGNKADFEKLPAGLVHAAFMGASELIKVQNNGRVHDSVAKTSDFGKVSSIAEMNKRNAEFWAKQSGQ